MTHPSTNSGANIPTADLTLAILTSVPRGRMKLTCRKCRESYYRTHLELARRFGGRVTFGQLQRRLVCPRCGARVWRSGQVVTLELDVEPPPRWWALEHGWGGFGFKVDS